MFTRSLVVFGALLFLGVSAITGRADDSGKLSATQIAQDRAKAQVASNLVAWGRATKDPQMLMVAARLLGEVSGDVADPKASKDGKPVYYDVEKIVAEAKGYPAPRSEALPVKKVRSGFCHYEYLCDSLYCSYEWVC